MDSANQSTPVIVRERVRPARNAPQAHSLAKVISKPFRASRSLWAGRRGPSKLLRVTLPLR